MVHPAHLCLWTLLAVTGQAIVLSSIDAGTQLHFFQYAYPLDRPVSMAFVALQAALVFAGFWRTGLRPPSQAYWLLPALLATAATVSRDPSHWAVETTFAVLAQLAALGALILAVRAAYPDRPIWVVGGPRRTAAGYRIIARPGR